MSKVWPLPAHFQPASGVGVKPFNPQGMKAGSESDAARPFSHRVEAVVFDDQLFADV
jgi:hypothetical protein